MLAPVLTESPLGEPTEHLIGLDMHFQTHTPYKCVWMREETSDKFCVVWKFPPCKFKKHKNGWTPDSFGHIKDLFWEVTVSEREHRTWTMYQRPLDSWMW